MAPLLSRNQLQSIRLLNTFSLSSRPLKQETVSRPADKKMTLKLSPEDCGSASSSFPSMLTEINRAMHDDNIVALNLEQVIEYCSSQPFSGLREKHMFFKAMEDLLLCDDRKWHRLGFFDTIDIIDFVNWKRQKEAIMLDYLNSASKRVGIPVRLRLVVRVPCSTKASTVVSFLKATEEDASIKTLMIRGALNYGEPKEAWKAVAKVFCYPEELNRKERESNIEFHIFYDGGTCVDSLMSPAGDGPSTRKHSKRSWSGNLGACIDAMETIIERRSGHRRMLQPVPRHRRVVVSMEEERRKLRMLLPVGRQRRVVSMHEQRKSSVGLNVQGVTAGYMAVENTC